MKIGFDQNISMVVKIRVVVRAIFSIGLMFAIVFISAGRWDKKMGLYISCFFSTFTLYYSPYCCLRWRTLLLD